MESPWLRRRKKRQNGERLWITICTVWQWSEPGNLMHYQNSTWASLNRITSRDGEMESQKKKTKRSQRHHYYSSSSSRTWRAKTGKESLKGEGHSSINTVQLFATILFPFLFDFLQYIKNQVEHCQRKKRGHVHNCLWQEVPFSYIWVCRSKASCSCHLRPISLCLMKWTLLTLSASSGYWSTDTT